MTDEKVWTTTRMINPENDRVRAKKTSDVEPYNLDKFITSRMSWIGITPRGTTGLKWLKGNVNGENRCNSLMIVLIRDVNGSVFFFGFRFGSVHGSVRFGLLIFELV